MSGDKFELARFPVHLGLGARVVNLPEHTGDMRWYADYAESTADDGVEGRLVSIHSFDAPWDTWEVHPSGDELVLCLSGRFTVHQEIDGGVRSIPVEPGEAVVNAPGVWHTADTDGPASALFITAGQGTGHKPR